MQVADSTLALVYGLENFVDFLSSAVVLWRFFARGKVNDEVEKKLKRRERRAELAISLVLLVLGMAITVTALNDLCAGQTKEDFINDDKDLNMILSISFISILIFGTLAAIKFRYAKQLDSPSLQKDGICSLIGTVLSASLFIDGIIINQNPGSWWVDPFISLLCGFLAILIGVHAMYGAHKEGLPIFSPRWWFLSQGDEDPNDDDDDKVNDDDLSDLALTPNLGSDDDGEFEEAIV